MADGKETVHLVQRQDYQFTMRFGGAAPDWLADEPPPLGKGEGPSPVQLLSAAVGTCLSDSLLFALRKFKNEPGKLRAEISAKLERNAAGRWRLPRARVVLTLGDDAANLHQVERVLAQFEALTHKQTYWTSVAVPTDRTS